MRDEFNQSTKDRLARRVGWRCSNPRCKRITCGPHTRPDMTVNIGVAAHITAASRGGYRYNPSMTVEQRCSIENGIWLCQDCAKLIDSDEVHFTVALLHDWKKQAEAEIRSQLEGENSRHGTSPALVEKIDTLIIASQESTGGIEDLKVLLREYVSRLIDSITPQSSPAVVSSIVEMIPLDNGYWLHPDDVAA